MSADASKPRLSTTGDPKDYSPTYGNPVVSTSNDVALQSEERSDGASGAKEPEKIGRLGANQYPGRPLPKPEQVKDAEAKPAGFAKGKADIQNASNRRELKD